MLSTWHWLGSWDISIWVDRYNALRCLGCSGFKCSSLEALSLLRLALLCEHSVVASASWNHHSSVGIAALDAFIEHDILRIVLPMKDTQQILSVT